jgi:transcriptional regulator GlxA family with amidase domain
MKTLAALVYPGFQTLDFFGPLEMLGDLGDDKTIADGSNYDLLLIPGGDSALEAAKSSALADWIVATASHAELIMTVCTGSILLATTGMLDGRKATTNKIDYIGTVPLGPRVDWVRQARWVEDGKFFTSSGVSAGMDMTLAAISHLFGDEVAREIAVGTEYEWHDDATWDPFAKRAGLV